MSVPHRRVPIVKDRCHGLGVRHGLTAAGGETEPRHQTSEIIQMKKAGERGVRRPFVRLGDAYSFDGIDCSSPGTPPAPAGTWMELFSKSPSPSGW